MAVKQQIAKESVLMPKWVFLPVEVDKGVFFAKKHVYWYEYILLMNKADRFCDAI